jgi:8-oxo-dGTP pyrophosphatase MutT (NUDIX family)
MTTIRKAYAYITHRDRLLVFSHPHAPEAGIQVPGGTVEPDETPEHAVMREACEETGLTGLVLVRFLGETMLDRSDVGKNEFHHRHFYHLRCTSDPPATWQHYELDPSDGSPPPLFEFFWAPLPDEVPELIADSERPSWADGTASLGRRNRPRNIDGS